MQNPPSLDIGLPFARETVPVLIPLLVGAGIPGSTAVGTSEIVGNKSFKELSAQVNTDLDHWEKSYVPSTALAKVAAQN